MGILPLRGVDDTGRIVCATLQKGSPHWSRSPFALIGDAPYENCVLSRHFQRCRDIKRRAGTLPVNKHLRRERLRIAAAVELMRN